MGNQHGRPSGADSAESLELDAAREDWQWLRAYSEARWEAYQKGKISRDAWQEAEAKTLLAGKRYAAKLAALAEAQAGEGKRGS